MQIGLLIDGETKCPYFTFIGIELETPFNAAVQDVIK